MAVERVGGMRLRSARLEAACVPAALFFESFRAKNRFLSEPPPLSSSPSRGPENEEEEEEEEEEEKKKHG